MQAEITAPDNATGNSQEATQQASIQCDKNPMTLLRICGKLPSDARRFGMSVLVHLTVRCLLSWSSLNLLCGSACPWRNSAHVESGSVCRPRGLGDCPGVLVSLLTYFCVCFRLFLCCLSSPWVGEVPCASLSAFRGSPKVHGMICLPKASLTWFALCLLSAIGNSRKPLHRFSTCALLYVPRICCACSHS